MQAEASVTSTGASCPSIGWACGALPCARPCPTLGLAGAAVLCLSVSSAGFALWQSPLVLWVGGDKDTPLPHSLNCLQTYLPLAHGSFFALQLSCHSCLPVGWVSGSGN